MSCSDIAVSVRNLSKAYRLQSSTSRATTVAEAVMRRLRHPLANPPVETFWALRDVSFELARGEVLAVVGRNGAGKSTLLKLLSRITPPTHGEARVWGRIGSLLEVGTGFHPELTGRENIFLNGAILGMRRSEVARAFEEIVAFAEIDRFLDTPVKHYSSGMYVRLAFAVAAQLTPEVLLVDEVLAVGDAAFQRKCLGKIGEVTRSGRSVILVSHNMTAVTGLCSRALWIEGGVLRHDGDVRTAVDRYLSFVSDRTTDREWPTPADAPGNEVFRLRRARLLRPAESQAEPPSVHDSFCLEFEFWNLEPEAVLNLSLHLLNEEGITVFNTGPVRERRWSGRPLPAGLFRSRCHVPGDLLNDGMYRVTLLAVRDGSRVIWQQDELLVFEILDSVRDRTAWFGRWPGSVRPFLEWETELLVPANPSDDAPGRGGRA